MSSGYAGQSKRLNEIETIPFYLLDWGWETSCNFDILEKELEVNKTYLVPQSIDFDPTSSWVNKKIFDETDLGKEKVFLQTNRMAEVNGMEFFQEEIDFDKIIIGKIVKIDNIEQALPMLLSIKSFEYNSQTPVYHITVKTIYALTDFLNDPNQEKLSLISEFKVKEQSVIKNDFNFGQLQSERQQLYKKYWNAPYSIEAHRLYNDLIVIYISTSEYSKQYYVIKKDIKDDMSNYFLRFYVDYFVDATNYRLVDYQLSEEEIELLTLDNPMCKNFFTGNHPT